MAITSYGSITIVDITDVGEFSVYPQANAPQTQIYNPDSSGNTAYTPDWSDANVTITPRAYYAGENVTSSCTYEWKSIVDGVTTVLTTADGVAQDTRSLVISSNVLGAIASGLITYEVTATYTYQAGLSPLTATGRIDFALVRQGASAKTIKITGDNLFKYNTDSVLTSADPIVLTGTYSQLTIDGWYYKKVVNDVITWETYPTTYNGNINTRGTDSNSNPTLSVYAEQQDGDANIFTNDVLTVKFKGHDINNTEYSDIYTLTKLRDGAAGTQTKSAVLTNEDQMIPSAQDGTVDSSALSGAITQLKIFNGGTEVNYNDWTITIVPSTGITISKSIDGTNWSTTANDHYTWVKVNSMTADTANVNFSATDGTITLTKQFSLIKVKAGADGKTPIIYSLESNTAAINRAAGTNGDYTPNSVTFNAYQQYVDSNDVVHKDPFNGHIVIYKDISDTSTSSKIAETSSNTNTLSKTLASSANYTVLRGVLYTDNTLATQLDSQSVIITTDGIKGDDGDNGFGAINIILGNEAEVIPCNSAYATTTNPNYIIDIPYEAYQGTAAVGVVVKTAGNFATGIAPNTLTAGHITYTIPHGTVLNSSGGSIQLTFTVTAQDYDNSGNVVTVTRDIDKVFSWAPSKAGGDGQNAMVLVINAPNTVFEKNPDSSNSALTATAILYNGNVSQTSNVSYAWHKYANGNYNTEITATSGTSATAWKSTTTVTNDTLNIKPNEVDGYASFRVTASYTPSGESTKTFYQYVVFTDKSDPIQVSVHSTVGLQIVNSQGVGAIYARVTQDGQAIDAVVDGIKAGIAYPSAAAGDFFVKLDDSSVALTSRKARLMEYNGSSWNEVSAECQYEWTFRNENNEPITSNVPYQDTDKTKNQFLYINSSLINNKITADVKVTKN